VTEQQPYRVVRSFDDFELRRYPEHLLAEVITNGPFDGAGNRAFRALFGYITGQNRADQKVAMTAPVLQTEAGAISQKIAMTAPVVQQPVVQEPVVQQPVVQEPVVQQPVVPQPVVPQPVVPQAAGEPLGDVPAAQNAAAAASAPLSGEKFRVAFVLPQGMTEQTAPRPTNPDVTLRTVPASLVAAIRFSGRWSEASYQQHVDRLNAALGPAGFTPVGPARYARFDPPYKPWFLRRNEVLFDVLASR